MPESVHFIGMCIVLLYGVSAMVLVGVTKVGGLMGSITKVSYRPDSSDAIRNMSLRAKIIHLVVFIAAAVVAFWPRGV